MIAKEPRASESNHWYTRDGVPMYTVEAAKGGQRNTTLRDARKLNLVPSVTTILNVAAKPGLTQWLQKQVLLAALTLPRMRDEPEDEFIARIIDDSKEQGRAAADAGTEIHASIQGFYEGQPVTRHQEHITGCTRAISDVFGLHGWIAERAFGHELGFGGKVDLHSPQGVVIDIKTKEFTDPAKVDAYDEHLMQLAAYRVGLGMPEARCANVFVSRSVPGLTRLVEWSQEDLARGWQMFVALLNFWQLKNQHR
ncbi:MAG: hypothetical protein RL434_1773 [Pseudomonadota bacterium]|jgi:hypothetical protein